MEQLHLMDTNYTREIFQIGTGNKKRALVLLDILRTPWYHLVKEFILLLVPTLVHH